MQQTVEFLFAHAFAKHAKNHRAFVEDNGLIRSRLIVQGVWRTRDRCCLLKRQGAFLLLALSGLEATTRQIAFTKCEGAPFSQALRHPRIVKRLPPYCLSPPFISHFALEFFFRHGTS